MVNWSLKKMPRTYSGERIVSLTNGVEKIGYPHAEKWNWTHVSHTIYKNQLKMDEDLNVRPETLKLLEGNTR